MRTGLHQKAIGRRMPKVLLLAAMVAVSLNPQFGWSESLFHASATYSADAPIAPRSLFAPPISHRVGDIVTILVEEDSSLESSAELKITRNQAINENGSSLFNNMLRFVTDKLPFNADRIERALQAPSFNGMNNQNNLGSKAESSRETTLQDAITCQVVQILPNGSLMVQGQKTVAINKERQDMVVTGIVNPYYLDRQNQIQSKYVANMQLIQGGKGVISRQQNDGIANKIYQFFN